MRQVPDVSAKVLVKLADRDDSIAIEIGVASRETRDQTSGEDGGDRSGIGKSPVQGVLD